MIDDLLDLSRIESGKVEIYPLPTQARLLVAGALDEHRPDADGKGIRLEMAPTPALISVLADRERIGHVFANLIGNALRHTPRGGSIELGAASLNGVVRFTVSDTGPGIAGEYRERIFEKFFQVPGTGAKGTGLGLYIAKEIVSAHGGEIGVESAPGQGSTFWFTLPRAERNGVYDL